MIRKYKKITALLLCVLIGMFTIGCQQEPDYKISFLTMEEAGVTPPPSESISLIAYAYAFRGREDMLVHEADTIVVGKVLEHQAIRYNSKTESVVHIIQTTDVLMGNCEIGDRIYLFMGADIIEDTFYPDQIVAKAGGFVEEGATGLFFLCEPRTDFKPFGENSNQIVRIIANEHISTRIINNDGSLGFLSGNQDAEICAFVDCNTVEEVRIRLSEAFIRLRDGWATRDHPLVHTFRAEPGATPGVPEGYKYYADMTESEREAAYKEWQAWRQTLPVEIR